jgi:hypothetical protein
LAQTLNRVGWETSDSDEAFSVQGIRGSSLNSGSCFVIAPVRPVTHTFSRQSNPLRELVGSFSFLLLVCIFLVGSLLLVAENETLKWGSFVTLTI